MVRSPRFSDYSPEDSARSMHDSRIMGVNNFTIGRSLAR